MSKKSKKPTSRKPQSPKNYKKIFCHDNWGRLYYNTDARNTDKSEFMEGDVLRLYTNDGKTITKTVVAVPIQNYVSDHGVTEYVHTEQLVIVKNIYGCDINIGLENFKLVSIKSRKQCTCPHCGNIHDENINTCK